MNSLAILTVDNMGVDIIFRQPTCTWWKNWHYIIFTTCYTFTFTTCYHQSHHFHHICYHQSSFLCLPYRRKLDVRSSQLLPAVLPVPLIGINTSNGCLLKPQDCWMLNCCCIYKRYTFLQSISVLVHFVVIFAPWWFLLLSFRTYSTKLVGAICSKTIMGSW